MRSCPQCGATYVAPDDTCEARWQRLLALDHSRQAPWGPLHALSFATWTLQHPDAAAPGSVARCRELLERVIGRGEPLARVAADFRARPPAEPSTRSLELPLELSRRPRRFGVTIADLGDFDGATFESVLQRWAQATLEAWFVAAPGQVPRGSV